jgi:pilus assembly protein CpaB
MKKKRTLVVLLLAILSGSVAAVSAVRYLEDRPTPLMASSPTEMQPVVVAAQDISLGTKLTAEDLRIVNWPSDGLPAGYATSTAEVVGRSVVRDIHMNEPILTLKLADTGLHGLIPLIPAGMRALSVKVDEVVGVAGFVTPQTRVDVILIMQPPGGQEPLSKVILQNIQALAANQQITENDAGQPIVSTVVTVLVTPEEAEKLSLAANQGRIQMALRNTLDRDTIETTGERSSRLFVTTVAAPPRPAAGRPVAPTRAPSESIIEMYRGGVRTLISYPGGND